jgi:Leucine-rich repeat (LRR) protein
LPWDINRATNMKSIYIDNTPISQLPEGIYSLRSLTSLYLTNTQLSEETKNRLRKQYPNTTIQGL